MKKWNKILSVGLSLVMCAGMVTPAFAASFTDLQDAINGTDDTNQIAGGRYGYGWNGTESRWGIEAWDEGGTRNVLLNEDVIYGENGATEKQDFVKVKDMNLTLNMNGNTIDGGNRINSASPFSQTRTGSTALIGVYGANITINGGATAEDTSNRGTLTGGHNSGLFFDGTGGKAVINYVDFTGNFNAYRDSGALPVDDGGAIDMGWKNWIELNYVNLIGNYSYRHSGAIAQDGGSTAYINNCVISDNHAREAAGAIGQNGATITIVNSQITGNTAGKNGGGLEGRGRFYVKGTTVITGNTAARGGGICLSAWTDEGFDVVLLIDPDVIVCDNTVTGKEESWDIDVYIDDEGAEMNYSGEHVLHGWTGAICTERGICSNCGEEMDHALGHDFGEWYVVREAQPGVPGEERRDCKRGDAFETRVIEMPDRNGHEGTDSAAVGIEDEAVPLAGIFTRADAVGYLWEQAGSPEWELSTFADVPEEHEWAVAIGWGQAMGIALADEEGNFRPDDLVLRSTDDIEGEFQEFLNRYAVYAGVKLDADELFIELEGEPDDVIMGEEAQVIFDEFFAKLEAADIAA